MLPHTFSLCSLSLFSSNLKPSPHFQTCLLKKLFPKFFWWFLFVPPLRLFSKYLLTFSKNLGNNRKTFSMFLKKKTELSVCFPKLNSWHVNMQTRLFPCMTAMSGEGKACDHLLSLLKCFLTIILYYLLYY